ncbi:MAG: hypothetical protein GY917_12135, partial [Planctomycetaceae bacterium]|nr:hypothetical protein [Planctomycetaceae bacterium]
MKSKLFRSLLQTILVIATLPALNLQAADGSGDLAVNVDTLRHVPVFHKGRIQPFDTFANIIMAEVCERPKKRNVKLKLADYLDAQQLGNKKYAAAVELFPAGEERSWDGTELIFSWLVESEKWEDVPFIYAPHPDLRKLL